MLYLLKLFLLSRQDMDRTVKGGKLF